MEEIKNLIELNYVSVEEKISSANSIYEIIKKIDENPDTMSTKTRGYLMDLYLTIIESIAVLMEAIRTYIISNKNVFITDMDWLLDMTLNRLPILNYKCAILGK